MVKPWHHYNSDSLVPHFHARQYFFFFILTERDSSICFVFKPLDWSCLSSLLTDSVLPERGDWGLLLLLSPFPLLLPPSLFLLSVLLLRWPLLPPSHLSGFNGCVSLLPAALECCFICPVIIFVHLFAFLSCYILGGKLGNFFLS